MRQFPLPPTCFHCKIFTLQKSSPAESAASHALCGIWKSFTFYAKNRQTRYCYHYTPGDAFFGKLSLMQLTILTVYPLQFSFFTFWQHRCAWREVPRLSNRLLW